MELPILHQQLKKFVGVKPSHSDQKNEKKTFIDILGFDQSSALANKITQDGILLLKQTGLNVEVLESIALQCMNRAN